MVETKKLSEPSQDRSPDTPTQEQFDNTFRSQTPVASTPENTQSTTAPTPKQEVPTPQPTLPQKTAPQPAQVQEQPKPVVPKSVTGQPVFVERQLQMDLDKYVTDEELLQGIVSKDITKNHLNYLKATDPDKFSKAVKFLSSQDAKVRAQRIRDNIVANDVEQAEVVEPPTYQSELQNLQEQATNFYKSLIDETDKASTTFSAQDLYNQTVNTEELSAKREEANKIASELEELQLERNKIRQQVEDQYGDDVPQAVIEAEIAKRARSFTDREMLLQSRYRTALADYQGAEQDAQTQFKLALQDAQQQEQIRWREIEMNMGIAKEAFNTQRQITQVRLNKMLADEQFAKETQLKEYRYNKELEDKVYLSQLSQEQQMALMEYETQLKLQTNMTNAKPSKIKYEEIDGKTYILDEYGNIISEFDPDVAGFQFNMNIGRSSKITVDTNNAGAITADGFSTPEAKANYGRKIGAIGTYTSPNGREYYVFNDKQSGAAALRDFTQRMVDGESVYNKDGSLLDAMRKYSGSEQGQKYAEFVANYAGVSVNTKLGQVDPGKMAEAISLWESGNEFDIRGLGMVDTLTKKMNASEKILLGGYESFDSFLSTASRVFRRSIEVGQGFNEKDVELKRQNFDEAVENGDIGVIIQEIRSNILSNKDVGATWNLYKQIMFSTGKISDLLAQYENTGKSMNVFNGTREQIAQKLGETNDPLLAEMSTYMGYLTADYLKSLSGTAASDTEREFISGLLPQIIGTRELNFSRIKTLQNIAKERTAIPIEMKIQDQIFSKTLFPELYLPTTNTIDYSNY